MLKNLIEDLPIKYKEANQNLKSQLIGNLILEITSPDETYYINFKPEECKVEKISSNENFKNSGSNSSKEASIKISKNNLENIMNGDLNPQVAMLSGKVKAQGDLNMSIYFFNLL